MNRNGKEKFCRLVLWTCVVLIAASVASAQPFLNLPSGPQTPTVTFAPDLVSLPSYMEVQFSGLPNGLDIHNSTQYLAWCAQHNGELDFSGPGPVIYTENLASYTLYNTYPNSGLPSVDQSANWPQVNYILNHKNGASVTDIQESI